MRYEDIISRKAAVEELSDFLGTGTIDKEILQKRIGSRGSSNAKLTVAEEKVLRAVAGSLRESLGDTMKSL